MASDAHKPQSFDEVKSRLEEIADAVADEGMPLDDALDLFEEAVTLGLRVGDLIELDVAVDEEQAGQLVREASAPEAAADDAAEASN